MKCLLFKLSCTERLCLSPRSYIFVSLVSQSVLYSFRHISTFFKFVGVLYYMPFDTVFKSFVLSSSINIRSIV